MARLRKWLLLLQRLLLHLLLLLLHWRCLCVWRLLLLLLLLLLSCAYGPQHPEGNIPCASSHIQVLHARKGTQAAHQTVVWCVGLKGMQEGRG